MASLAASLTGDLPVAAKLPARVATPAAPSTVANPLPAHAVSAFAADGQNWTVLGAIAAAHAGIVALLLTTGAIQVGKSPAPVAVNFVEEIAEPTPVEPTEAPEAALEPVPTEVFVPDVLVETPAPPPPVVTVTEVAPPPKAVTSPATVKGSGDAPVVPPDFMADQLNNPGPRYPSASRRAHEEGTVMLKVLVSPDGRAQDLTVATSSGFSRLDEAALATVKRWAFVPAKKAGKAVSAWVLVPVTFDLGDGRGERRGRGARGRDRRGDGHDGPGPDGLGEGDPVST